MSGKATALAEAKKLKQVMAKHGVQCSIELQVGRPWSGDDWYSRKHVLVNHHTAGAKTGNTPSLALVKRGRGADLPGPLCNGYGGRDHIYRVICMGLANHPGAGGPLTVAGFTLPKDSARISGWGTEWEHDGVSAWPAGMQEFMGRSNAALCEYLDISAGRSIEHKTWAPRRKIDRFDYTAETGQQEIKTWAGKTATAPKPATVPAKPQEDDMLTVKEIWEADLVPVTQTSTAKKNPTWSPENALGRVVDRSEQIYALLVRTAAEDAARDAVNAAALQALAAGGGLTVEQAVAAGKAGAQAALVEIGELLAVAGPAGA